MKRDSKVSKYTSLSVLFITLSTSLAFAGEPASADEVSFEAEDVAAWGSEVFTGGALLSYLPLGCERVEVDLHGGRTPDLADISDFVVAEYRASGLVVYDGEKPGEVEPDCRVVLSLSQQRLRIESYVDVRLAASVEIGSAEIMPRHGLLEAQEQLDDALQSLNNCVEDTRLRAAETALETLERFEFEMFHDQDAREFLVDAKIRLAQSYMWYSNQQSDLQAAREAEARVRSLLRSTLRIGVPAATRERVKQNAEMEAMLTELEAQLDHAQQGTLVLATAGPCELMLDGAPIGPGQYPVDLGAHTIWSHANEAPTRRGERRSVELDVVGQLIDLQLCERPLASSESLSVSAPPPELMGSPDTSDSIEDEGSEQGTMDSAIDYTKTREPRARPRLLPRWASTLGVVIGATLTAAGTTLLVLDHFDGQCVNGKAATTSGPDGCPMVAQAGQGGPALSYSLLGIGTAGLGTFGVILGIDEVRTRRREDKVVSLGLSLRF